MENGLNPFLDEVLKCPNDDGPKLIYADWLEEQGTPRGEFIRVQCELAQTDRMDARYFDLVERSDTLLGEYREQWAGELKQDIRKAEFHHGFIDTITIRARAFAKEADELFRATPVHWVRFNYVKGAGATLADIAALRNIRSLDLSRLKIPHEDLVSLVSSPHFAELQDLNLTYQQFPLRREVGAALSAPQRFGALRTLDVMGNDYAIGFLDSLVSGDGFPNLEKLAIGADYREQRLLGLGRLTAPNLRSLDIHGPLDLDDTRSLCQLPLSQLTRIGLSGRGSQRSASR